VIGHENASLAVMVVWAAQSLVSDSFWLALAGADGADPVEGAEGTEVAGLVAGLEDVGRVTGSGDFAGLVRRLEAAPCCGVFDGFDGVAGVIDAIAGAVDAADSGVTAATGRGGPPGLAWRLLPAGVAAQAVTPRAIATSAVPPAVDAIPRLRSPPVPSLPSGLPGWSARS
jgi:hypothetical protein